MKNFVAALAMILATVYGYAQSTRPAYIILNQDTLRGSVTYREGMEMMQLCTFQAGTSFLPRSTTNSTPPR